MASVHLIREQCELLTVTIDVREREHCNVSSHLMTPEGQATRSALSTLRFPITLERE